MINLFTEYSLVYSIIGVLVGLVYAGILYQKPNPPWNKVTNWLLAFGRFLLVFTICFLLLNPFVRQIKNTFEKPVIVFATDNSQSVWEGVDSATIRDTQKKLDQIANQLTEKGFEIDIQSFNEIKEYPQNTAINFDFPTTNLNGLLQRIRSRYENRNLSKVVLLSDGIYNRDISPLYTPYNLNIFTIGVGDTTQKKDINLKHVYHNKMAYLGNKFPLVAEVHHFGFSEQEVAITLARNDEILEEKIIRLGASNYPQEIEFFPEATKKGMQHFTISIRPLEGEFSRINNTKHIYVDVLDGKEKILLVAASPHPDIRAIRTAIEKNKNYEFTVFIPNLSPPETYKKTEKYDVVIFHQIPHFRGVGNQIYDEIREKNIPIFYIFGKGSNYSAFNRSNDIGTISQSGRQTDNIIPAFNENFQKFTFDKDKQTTISSYPPASVPFGNYTLAPTSEIVLFQQVGNIQTKKPLLVINEQNGKKSAMMTGEGLWQWRLQEFAKNENQEAFDELIIKIIQYLSVKEDKRKFRVQTTANEYFDSETVLFETEVYNTIYEHIYGQKIDLTLTNEKGEKLAYTYANSGANFRYEVNGLPQGIYRFRATTELNGKIEVSTGEFTVKSVQVEAMNMTADFALLRQLSQQTGGAFFKVNNLKKLEETLLQIQPKNLIRSSEEIESILHLKWIFFLLISLISIEWVIRKLKGSY